MHDTLFAADGSALRLRRWPAPGDARGTVLIVHGLGEHIGRYAALAARLNAWGWHVAGHDQRGHGESEGARGALPTADALLDDLALVVDAVRAELPAPLVLLGHSMGGVVAARFVAGALETPTPRWSRPIDALVLTSPALDPGLGTAQKLQLALAVKVAPNKALANRLDPAWVSRDPAVVAAYRTDPLVHDRITPRLTRFIVDGGEFVRGVAPRWRVPTLLMWAGSDRCVAPSGCAEFAAAAPKAVLQAQVFEPLYHEIFNEPEQAQVFMRLQAWLQQGS